MIDRLSSPFVYNSSLETGIRSVCILIAGFSLKFDLQQMLAFDHIVVHTGDVPNGPPSLHPSVQQRNGELLVRRPIVQKGLDLMELKGLVSKEASEKGIYFSATEFAPIFIKSLQNQYIQELTGRSEWVVKTYQNLGSDTFYEIFNTVFDRWTSEFQIADVVIGGR